MKNDNFTQEKIKFIICWCCQAQVIVLIDWERVTCPICFNENIIPLKQIMKPNINFEYSNKIISMFIEVKCSFCSKLTITKRESDYLICSNCKNSNIIIKDENFPYGLDPIKIINHRVGNIFNPYQRNDYFKLEKEFEKKLVFEKFSKRKDLQVIQPEIQKQGDNFKYIINTFNDITSTVKNIEKFNSPQYKKINRITEIMNNNFFSNFKK